MASTKEYALMKFTDEELQLELSRRERVRVRKGKLNARSEELYTQLREYADSISAADVDDECDDHLSKVADRIAENELGDD